MKKTILILGLSILFSSVSFASNKNNEKKAKDETKNNYGQTCCRRGYSNSDGENVSVRACVGSTGDYQIDLGKACEKAAKAAKAALVALTAD